jgi:peptidoglycan/LPS O-acetylase OafA/YrhL
MHDTTQFHADVDGRRHDLDWVRIIAFMLLILYHVGMYYVTWDYHVKSPHASHAIEPLMMLTSPWRLALLFLVSGVATGYLLDRRGVRAFIGQRSLRLLVPLVFGMLVIVPPQSYFEVVEQIDYAGSFTEFWRLYVTGYKDFCDDDGCLIVPTWNHLWFVAYLWIYTVLLLAVFRFWPAGIARLRALADRRLGGLAVVLLPVAWLVAARLELASRFPSTHALVDDWYNHAVYAPIFLLGFALAGTRAPWATLERVRWHALGLAVLGWAALVAYMGSYANGSNASPEALRMLIRIVYGAEQWLAIVAVLGFARRHLNRDNAARRYLTAAVFPVYILHQTVIIVFAHALKDVGLDPATEGALLVLVTGALCFLGYEIVRRSGVLRPLFGLARLERRAPAAPLMSHGAN